MSKYPSELIINKEWSTALIVYDKSNWDYEVEEKDRTFRVSRKNSYFTEGVDESILIGDCINGKDLSVRLDNTGWIIEKTKIEFPLF